MTKNQFFNIYISKYLVENTPLSRSNIDSHILSEDIGDVLPYLVYLSGKEAATVLFDIHLEKTALDENGLILESNGDIRLFHNHDWLLGVLYMSDITGRKDLDQLVTKILDYVESKSKKGLLRDTLSKFSFRESISSPYNLGYYEELVRVRSSSNVRKQFQRNFDAYLDSTSMLKRKIVLNKFYGISLTKTRFFKDMSNGIHAGLSMLELSGSDELRETLIRTINRTWKALIEGKSPLPGVGLREESFGIRDLFAWMDIIGRSRDLFPMDITGLRVNRLLSLLKDHEMDNGIYSEYIYGNVGHLDGNVDLVSTLFQFQDLYSFNQLSLVELSNRIFDKFSGANGLVLRVDGSDKIVDDRIITKYQFLAAKLCLVIDNVNDKFLLLDR